MIQEILTTRQVATALGVSEASLKRWCDRGLLPAVRTPGGHRRLPLSGVMQFIRERRLEVARPDVLGLPEVAAPAVIGRDGSRNAFLTALEHGDLESARRLVFGLYLDGRSVVDILDGVIAATFQRIGDRWAHGALDIYHERRAVEICTRVLHQFRLLLPPPATLAPSALGGTLTGDHYTLATTMVELSLTEVGWRAQSLGCDHPVETLVRAISDLRPRIFWLSVNALESRERFVEQYQQLYHVAQEHGVAVLLGGRMLTEEIRRGIRYAAFCDNLQHAVAFARALYQPPTNGNGSGGPPPPQRQTGRASSHE